MLDRRILTEAVAEVAAHPLLQEAAAGHLTVDHWIRYFSARLEAGPGFVTFLQSLEAQAQVQHYPRIAEAAGRNRDEELGILKGVEHDERRHERWREWFRVGMRRILAEEGREITFRPADDFTEVQRYPRMFAALAAQSSALRSAGALAMLEEGLAEEYTWMLQGMRPRFGSKLTAQEIAYFVSHAHHDRRHTDEIWEPLAEACVTDADVREVATGITMAKDTKLAFLTGAYRIKGDPKATA